MEYVEDMTFLEYIQHNVEYINNFEQGPFQWKFRNNGDMFSSIRIALSNFPEFAAIEPSLNDELTREDVANCFQRGNNYVGLITTVLWGGGHKGANNNFKHILEEGEDSIYNKIAKVRNILEGANNDSIIEAFNSMMNGGENHINGLGESFISKVLYFLRFNHVDEIQPLIFDKFAMCFHCAMLIDDLHMDANQMYALNNEGNLILRDRRIFNHVYIDYCTRMHNIANQYNIKRADKLEAALFGEPTRGAGLNNANPRFFAREYVNDYFRHPNRHN